MHLHVVHETVYDYVPPVHAAYHLCHLKPSDNAAQALLNHDLRVSPAPSQQYETTDLYGNTRTWFNLLSPHPRLQVVSDSQVQTRVPVAVDTDMAWEEVRERMCYRRDAVYDPAAEFVFGSPYVPRDDRFADYAIDCFAAGRGYLECATELMSRIHEEFDYETEATDASTPALESLALRQGVCQDFAHVMLGCLRSLGLPARYVSGYLLTVPPPGRTRLVGSDASHAWVDVYFPTTPGSGIWTGLDPTNDRAPGEDYVHLASGRDYSDVSPMRGVIHGGANHTLSVAVTVSPIDPRPDEEGEPHERE